MKNILLTFVTLLVLSGVGFTQTYEFHTKQMIVVSAGVDSIQPVYFDSDIDIVVNVDSALIMIGDRPVKYRPETERSYIITGIVTTLYNAVDFEGEYCLVSTNIGKNDKGEFFLLLGVWYKRGRLYWEAYPKSTFLNPKYIEI